MQAAQLKARSKRRRLPGDSGQRPEHSIAPNILDRQFEAAQPNQRWLYVAVVLDLYSRRAVGWSMSSSMTAQLVIDALMMALWRGGKPTQLMHHSDQGSQLEFKESSQHQAVKLQILVHSTPRPVFSSLASCAACHSR